MQRAARAAKKLQQTFNNFSNNRGQQIQSTCSQQHHPFTHSSLFFNDARSQATCHVKQQILKPPGQHIVDSKSMAAKHHQPATLSIYRSKINS